MFRSFSLSDFHPAILLLEDGSFFEGFAVGRIGTTVGEICFNTGMTGYQEIFTDPSYYGQILITTHCHIGNYGTNLFESESDGCKIAGLICKNFSFQASGSYVHQMLQDFLEYSGVVAIGGIDTRALVRKIRCQGVMNAIISSEILDIQQLRFLLADAPSMEGRELATQVSTPKPYFVEAIETEKYKVAVIDFGVKKSILQNLAIRGCKCCVFPADTSLQKILQFEPDGIVLSNGPGDPASMGYAVSMVRRLLVYSFPIMGICLGHLILALALGAQTYKMHFGHRGLNHPVINLKTTKAEITSQNHGFAIEPQSIKKLDSIIAITHINLNDKSIEGIEHKEKPWFSIQYHPEASPGTHDSNYLFQQFVDWLN
ncbi:MAG: glutamine-hydrolyzing carbamoyl-phosphate synthase small subunit [Bacteroidia bacterium]|nr:glutamine-hydrolyzing carbamoyl-phosphate synthase small subunit [Bacteroidia bacterium]